jgi:hypothetical protein
MNQNAGKQGRYPWLRKLINTFRMIDGALATSDILMINLNDILVLSFVF